MKMVLGWIVQQTLVISDEVNNPFLKNAGKPESSKGADTLAATKITRIYR
jgi:hypothetical protein